MEPQKQATCESAIQLGDLTINVKGGKHVPEQPSEALSCRSCHFEQ